MSSDGINHFDGSYDDLMASIKDKSGLVVVDFFATWCGPCQRLGQLLPKIAEENPTVSFYKVDIDKNGDAATKFGVRSIPHIVFMKDSNVVSQIIGADIPKIKDTITQFK